MTTTRTILMASAAVLIAASLNTANSADMAHAVLKDKQGKNVGHVELTATKEGVRLRVSLKGVPAGERAFHIHEVGKCEGPSFKSAGGHFNPDKDKHGGSPGQGSGTAGLRNQGHAGDMPNLKDSAEQPTHGRDHECGDNAGKRQTELRIPSRRYCLCDPSGWRRLQDRSRRCSWRAHCLWRDRAGRFERGRAGEEVTQSEGNLLGGDLSIRTKRTPGMSAPIASPTVTVNLRIWCGWAGDEPGRVSRDSRTQHGAEPRPARG